MAQSVIAFRCRMNLVLGKKALTDEIEPKIRATETVPPEANAIVLGEAGVICDFREPDVIRAAPVALYNTFDDVYRFAEIFKAHAQ